MDAKTIKELKVGDVVECGKLFPGLSSESVCWHFLGSLRGKYQFRLYYAGAHLGHKQCTIKGETVEWEKAA
jgi:hypothetical protein